VTGHELIAKIMEAHEVRQEKMLFLIVE